ncbi:uncharacterized protein LOC143225879 isoform X2 [Tachypleus tridentatus]
MDHKVFSKATYLLAAILIIGSIMTALSEETADPNNEVNTLRNGLQSLLATLHSSENNDQDETNDDTELVDNLNPDDWRAFTPLPVTNPQCYVETQKCETERIPGRCIKLGGAIPACQTQTLLTLHEFAQCG